MSTLFSILLINKEEKSLIYKNVVDYCSKNNLSISAFEKMCGLTNGTVYGWQKRGSNPSLETLKKISAATKIPIEKWIKEQK